MDPLHRDCLFCKKKLEEFQSVISTATVLESGKLCSNGKELKSLPPSQLFGYGSIANRTVEVRGWMEEEILAWVKRNGLKFEGDEHAKTIL